MGACLGMEVTAGETPRRGNVVFRFANGKISRCKLEIDGSNPPPLISLLMK
jgi:hypothetical protein